MTTIASIKEVTLNKTGETSYYFTDGKGLQHSLSEEGWIEACDGFEYTKHEFKQDNNMTVNTWYA